MKTNRNYLFRYLVPVMLAIVLMTTVGACKSKSLISSITISPISANIKQGSTQQFSATGKHNDGSTVDITKQVTWMSSDTSIASISNSGLATGVALGSTHITASLSGVTSQVVILQVATKMLSSIKVTPASPGNFAVGAKQQFTATGTYDDGSVADISFQVTWSSSNTSIATISSSGLVTAVAAGASIITASVTGITSPPVTATVVAATSTPILKSIAITPAAPSNLMVGSTQQFTAVGTYSDGSIRDITTQVEWMSDTPIAVTINSNGLATAVAPGTANITAFFYAVMSPKVVLTVVSASTS